MEHTFLIHLVYSGIIGKRSNGDENDEHPDRVHD